MWDEETGRLPLEVWGGPPTCARGPDAGRGVGVGVRGTPILLLWGLYETGGLALWDLVESYLSN